MTWLTEHHTVQSNLTINGIRIPLNDELTLSRYVLRIFPLEFINVDRENSKIFEPHEFGAPRMDRIVLSCRVKEALDRLELFGYSKERCKEEFFQAKKERLDEISRLSERARFMDNASYPDQSVFQNSDRLYSFISNLTFERYSKAIHEVIRNKWERILVDREDGKTGKRSIIPPNIQEIDNRFIVCNSLRAINIKDDLALIRTILEVVKNESVELKYNLDVFYEMGADGLNVICDHYEGIYEPLTPEARFGLKTIILTEGSTDAEILEHSLVHLYPHLADLYSFVNFKLHNGSASQLHNLTISLSASGIPNNIISIFDNDYDGRTWMEKTQNNKLPANVEVTCYPDIAIANNYPTKYRDQEIVNMNMNGKGAAIEMYFGEDVLTQNGQLINLISSDHKQYRFPTKVKNSLKERFMNKFLPSYEGADWDSIRCVLEHIIEQDKNIAKRELL